MSIAGRRIALFTLRYPPFGGELASTAGRLAAGLARSGADVLVITTGPAGGETMLASEEVTMGARVCRVSSRYEGLALLEFEDAERRFDIMHGIGVRAAYACLQVLPAGQRAFLVSLGEAEAIALGPGMASPLERAAWVTAISADTLNRGIAVCPDVVNRSSVIAPGLGTEPAAAWSPRAAHAGVVGIPIDMQQPAAVRRAIDLYQRLPASLRQKLILIDGHGPDDDESEEIQQLRCACALAPDLEIRSVDGDRGWTRDVNVVVMSENLDGALPMLRQAAEAGVPIAGARVDGVSELLVDDVSARLVPPGDPDRLAGAIMELLATPDLAARLSAAVRQAVAPVTPGAECQRYIDIYERLLAREAMTAAASSAARP